MLLTPPDMLSQTLLAIPMWLLFEAGLFISRYYEQQPRVAAARGAGRTAESGED
jgi:Sec-independent protein secretion pathway component TatC